MCRVSRSLSLSVGGVYATVPLCLSLFCLSKQHMQHSTPNEKGTSRRHRFFIYQFQLSSLGFLRISPPLPYKLLAELLLAGKAACLPDKRDNPKKDYAACNSVPAVAVAVFYQPQADRDRHRSSSPCACGEGVKNES